MIGKMRARQLIEEAAGDEDACAALVCLLSSDGTIAAELEVSALGVLSLQWFIASEAEVMES